MTRLILDRALAAITIWQEARGQSHDLRVAVGEVIRERMKRRIFSDGTVSGTVLRPFQFSGFNTNDPNRMPSFRADDFDPIVADCLASWDESENTSLVGGATHYYSPAAVKIVPLWASTLTKVANIDGTLFFRQA